MTFPLFKTAHRVARALRIVPAFVVAFGVGAPLICSISTQAQQQAAKDASAYTIKRIYKTGDADRYRVTVKMNMGLPSNSGTPLDISENMVMKETTKEAKEDGTCVMLYEFPVAAVTANGMDMDVAAMLPTVTTTIDKSGKTDVKVDGGNAQMTDQMGPQFKQFTNAANAYMPKKPVKVGDSWELKAEDIGSPGQNVKGKATLVSIETIKGMKVGKIRSTTELTGPNNIAMHTVSTSFIVLATGKALNVTSKTEGDMLGGKMQVEMVMKMLDPEEKGDAKEPVKTDTEVKKP